MYIHRSHLKVKPGCWQSAIDLLLEESQRVAQAIKLQVPVFGASDQVVLDIAFQDRDEFEHFWCHWNTTPEAQEFTRRWKEMTLGGEDMFLRLHEPRTPNPPPECPSKFINRRTFLTYPYQDAEAIEILKIAQERSKHTFHVLTPVFGIFNQIIVDFDVPDMETYFEGWQGWGESPEGQEFLQRWQPLMQPGGANELWEVVT